MIKYFRLPRQYVNMAAESTINQDFSVLGHINLHLLIEVIIVDPIWRLIFVESPKWIDKKQMGKIMEYMTLNRYREKEPVTFN